ncbi:MAG: oligosaccharide flippase family protein [Bacteroides thetaiotaomicron]
MKSYWGLIIALLSEYLFRLIYSFFVYPYKVKFVIDKDKFYELYRFGGVVAVEKYHVMVCY